MNTALADISCCFTMGTGVVFGKVSFCSVGRMVDMSTSMKVVHMDISMAKFSSILKSRHISKPLILINSVMLPLIFSRFSDADKSDGCIS